MTPSVGPKFSLFRTYFSQDDVVALGIGSCHPTTFSVIASGVHHSQGCELQ